MCHNRNYWVTYISRLFYNVTLELILDILCRSNGNENGTAPVFAWWREKVDPNLTALRALCSWGQTFSWHVTSLAYEGVSHLYCPVAALSLQSQTCLKGFVETVVLFWHHCLLVNAAWRFSEPKIVSRLTDANRVLAKFPICMILSNSSTTGLWRPAVTIIFCWRYT